MTGPYPLQRRKSKRAVTPSPVAKSAPEAVSAAVPLVGIMRSVLDGARRPSLTQAAALQRHLGNARMARLLHGGISLRGTTPVVQPKLQLGPVRDNFEREADQNAAKMGLRTGGRAGIAPASAGVARRATAAAGRVSGGRQPLDSKVASSIQSARGGGRGLDETVRRSMEDSFGVNFSGVKVHADSQADSLSQSLQARAFTVGRDVFFRQGQYRPGSTEGRQLLAHELTHVVQQGAATDGTGTIQRKGGDKGNPVADIQAVEQTLTPNFAPLSDNPPANFEVTVAVAQGLPEYLKFAKTRMKSVIRNKARSVLRSVPGMGSTVRKPKTSAEIKTKAATKAAPQASGQADQAAIKRIVDNSDSVGHAWIKFTSFDAEGDGITTYSFGFIAQTSPTNPQQAVAGVVRNPDLEFETDTNRRYLKTDVDAKQYLKGLRKATELAAAPPNYSTIGYNCTKFVKDVAKAAGATIPGKIGMMMPISSRGLLKQALNPNRLYDQLGKNVDTETDSPEATMIEDGFEQDETTGMLVTAEDKAQQMTAQDVYDFLSKNRWMVSTYNRAGRAKWEEEGLRDYHLQLLTREQLQQLHAEEEIDLISIFDVMGVPTTNVPGRRRQAWDRF